MLRKSFVFSVIGTVIFFLCSVSSADVPGMINYQGKLTTPEGGLVNDTVQMTFSIYPDTLGSPADWSETQDEVVVRDGMFNVLLGSVNPTHASLFDGSVKFLGVQVESDSEMRPLKAMVTTGYSFRSQEADTAEYARTAPAMPDDDWIISGDNIYRLNGNVGIGLTDPAEKLHVAGTAHMTGFKMPTGASSGYVLTSDGNGAGTWQEAAASSGDKDWTFRITDTADTTLITGGVWGIARYGNVLYGNGDSTHVNLGVACTTGLSYEDFKYCTVGGGLFNLAMGDWTTVGGGWKNVALDHGATVGGGYSNSASGGRATVGGGEGNAAISQYVTVGGGYSNSASGPYSTIGGGYSNSASGGEATVGGGYSNSASDYMVTVAGGAANTASVAFSTVGGGESNTASAQSATIGGGYYNTASGEFATVGGGRRNIASGVRATVGGGSADTASGYDATVAGGYSNSASGGQSTIGGGHSNSASGTQATVAGGCENTASGNYATAGGGAFNAASGYLGTVGGGYNDTASGNHATVGGGSFNTASGSHSTVPGGNANTAAGHASVAAGSHVFIDSLADCTFAFGYNFRSSTPHATIFYDAVSEMKLGIQTTSPTARLDVNSSTGYNQIRMRTSYTPTATNDPNGNVGDIAWDDDFFYVKTSAGWKRAALTTF